MCIEHCVRGNKTTECGEQSHRDTVIAWQRDEAAQQAELNKPLAPGEKICGQRRIVFVPPRPTAWQLEHDPEWNPQYRAFVRSVAAAFTCEKCKGDGTKGYCRLCRKCFCENDIKNCSGRSSFYVCPFCNAPKPASAVDFY